MKRIENLFRESFGVTRVGVEYPEWDGKEDETFFSLPVRRIESAYQVWNGEEWLPLKATETK